MVAAFSGTSQQTLCIGLSSQCVKAHPKSPTLRLHLAEWVSENLSSETGLGQLLAADQSRPTVRFFQFPLLDGTRA